MQVQVGKWGNSLAIRIPGVLAKALGLREGTDLDVALVNGGLLMRPRVGKCTLDELLARVTAENLHCETDWGLAVGAEAW
jgi:antitoxin MazE